MSLPAGARWVWVDQPTGRARGKTWPKATVALVVKNGRIVDAAPIARQSIGRDEKVVAAFFRARGARFVDLGVFLKKRGPAGDERGR
jgi:hypothetical protein